MKTRPLTDFGLCVRTELLKRSETQEWLIQQVEACTGMYIDRWYLYKILTGQRHPKKIMDSICEILEIPKEEPKT